MEINNYLLEGDNIIHLDCHKDHTKFADGLPDTIVIHYTEGSSAESSANYLCYDNVRSSAHIVIGRNGEIYQLVPFNIKAMHAGVSHYAGRSSLNRYSIGIELDNAGEMTKVGSEFISKFGRKYQPNDVIASPHRNDPSQRIRYWHVFTEKQLQKCREVCILLMDLFDINTIVGHDEIAPERKTDPGPAFPMEKFRYELLEQNRSDKLDIIDKEGEVIADLLNIRENAGVNFEKVAKPLKRGKEVKVIEEYNGWYKVQTTIEGWVSKGYIKLKE
jgi:N-acetylmuramoyl-L-alanine amidase